MASKLSIIIDAKDQFSKTFKQAGSAVTKLSGMASSVAGPLKGAGIAIAGMGVAAAGAATAIFAITKSTASAIDNVQKFSDQIGVSTEFISKMDVAAGFAAVRVETVHKAMQQMQVAIGDAARGVSGPALEAFEQLGVSVKDAEGKLKDAETIMPEIAEGFKNLGSEALKSSVASKLFGLRGIEMLQLFKQGSAGLKAMTDESDRFGVTIGSKTGPKAAEFNDALYRIDLAFRGIKQTLVIELFPVITDLANKFAGVIGEFREDVIKEWAESISESLEKVDWEDVAEGIGDIATAMWNMLKAGKAVVSWMGEYEKWTAKHLYGYDERNAKVIALEENEKKLADALKAQSKITDWDKSFYPKKVEAINNEVSRLTDTVKIQRAELEKYQNIRIDEALENAFPDISKITSKKDGTDTGGTGTGDGGTAIINKTQEKLIASLTDMWNGYYLTQDQQIDTWAAKQREVAGQNQEAITLINQIAAERHNAISVEKQKKYEEHLGALKQATKASQDAMQQMYLDNIASEDEKIQISYANRLVALEQHYDAVLEQDNLSKEQKLEAEKEYQEALDALEAEFDALKLEKKLEQDENEAESRQEKLDALNEWYNAELELYKNNAEAKAQIDKIYAKKKKKIDEDEKKKKLEDHRAFSAAMYDIDKFFGIKGFNLSKSFKIVEALQTTYEAAINAYNSQLYIPIIGPVMGAAAAGIATAFGLARVASIAGLTFSGAAHGGLTNVPEESTYLLQRGERVLSPNQNRDLTDYMSGATSASTSISVDNFTMAINVPNADALVNMTSTDWEMIAQERVFPAFQKLASQGQSL